MEYDAVAIKFEALGCHPGWQGLRAAHQDDGQPLQAGLRRDGKAASTVGKSTITGEPGTVQPVSQHLPGCRFWVMARWGSCGAAAGEPSAAMPRSSRRSTSSTLEPIG